MLLERHQERVQHQEWLSGMIGAAVRNSGMNHPDKFVLPHDMVPSLPVPKQKRKRINRQAVADNIRAFFFDQMKLKKPS